MSKSKPIIGLAGGIGSGKSSVAKIAASMGACVIDADAIARAALDEPAVKAKLTEWWGNDVIDADGRVDRKRVADRIFADEAERRRLESLIHPIVAERRRAMIEAAMENDAIPMIVLDVPLLYEVGLDQQCDRVIFVDTNRATRVARLGKTRNWDEAELARREKNQWPLDRKLQLAHDILDNNTGEAERDAHVRTLLRRILESTTHAPPAPGSPGTSGSSLP